MSGEKLTAKRDGGTTTWLARGMLVLTSLAPIAVVYAFVLVGRGDLPAAAVCFGVALALTLICVGLISKARKSREPVNYAITNATPKDGDALAFLVAYALPIVVSKPDSGLNVWGFVGFMLVMGFVVAQQQLFHINPLLAWRYHFHTAKNDAGGPVLILSRTKSIPDGRLPIIKLSDYLLLDCSN